MLHPQNAPTSATVGTPVAAASVAAKCSTSSPSLNLGDTASQLHCCPPPSDPLAPHSFSLFSTPLSSAQLAGQQLLHLDNERPSSSPADDLRPDDSRPPAPPAWAAAIRTTPPARSGGRSRAPWPWRSRADQEASARSRGGAPRRRARDEREAAPCSTSLLPKPAATSIRSWRPSSPRLARGPGRDP
jgi:hypothetical protein